jgi:hypothetical protein
MLKNLLQLITMEKTKDDGGRLEGSTAQNVVPLGHYKFRDQFHDPHRRIGMSSENPGWIL